MRGFYPYYRYQTGGERNIPGPAVQEPVPLLPVVTDPKLFARLYGANAGSDLAFTTGVPSRSQMEALLQQQLVEEAAKRRMITAKKRGRVSHEPVPRLANPDFSSMGKSDGRVLKDALDIQNGRMTDAQLAQWDGERDQLQADLMRLGYPAIHVAAFAQMGRGRLQPFMQQQLDEQAAGDYRVRHHPDYDPQRSVDEQRYLNLDNSLRARVLRGKNMLLNTGNPVGDFVTGIVTAPGQSFANLTMDAENQYVKPGLAQGALNFGTDVLSLVPGVPEQAASSLVNRASPRALSYLANPTVQGAEDLGTLFPKRANQKVLNKLIKSKKISGFTPIPLDDNFKLPLPKLQESSEVYKEIRKAAYNYHKLTEDPRYLERVRLLDQELGMDGELEKRLNLFHKQGEVRNLKDIVSPNYLPFNIKIDNNLPSRVWGESNAHHFPDAYTIMRNQWKSGEIDDATFKGMLSHEYYTPQARAISIAPSKYPRSPFSEVVDHELKHHWTNGLNDTKGNIQNYADLLRSTVRKNTKDIEDASIPYLNADDLKYLSKPTEIDAHLMTNLRKNMVDKEYLKDHFDELTEEILDRYLSENLGKGDRAALLANKYFRPGRELIGDKKRFVDVFNKALPVATGVAVGAGAINRQKKWGGVPGLPVVGLF